MLTLEELKERVAVSIDPDLLVELLDLSSEDILDRFEDILEQRRYKFEDYEHDS